MAAFPPSRRAGNVVLRPLTLAGAVRLGEIGVDCGEPVARDKLMEVAFILSGGREWRRFLRQAKCGLSELSRAVEAVLNDAFATFVKPMPAKGGTIHLTPHGLGWPIEYAEWLCAEYGWGWGEALQTPVATVYALEAAARQRNGGSHGGLDYNQRRYAAELKAGTAPPVRLDNGKEMAV